ncbi:MAG: hypothetical protein PHP85_01410 [Gallionella sp.]|nr:hypothetical protein [Gallionella sp.]
MKSIKLVLAVLLLCVSQFAMAVLNSSQQAALDAALGTGATQAEVDAAVQAGANNNVSLADLIAYLAGRNVSGTSITTALANNINSGTSAGGSNPSCAPSCQGQGQVNVSYHRNDVTAINSALAANGFTNAGAAGSGVGFAATVTTTGGGQGQGQALGSTGGTTLGTGGGSTGAVSPA